MRKSVTQLHVNVNVNIYTVLFQDAIVNDSESKHEFQLKLLKLPDKDGVFWWIY